MLHEIISYIGSLDPALIYLVLFIFAFIENIFPPSPEEDPIPFGGFFGKDLSREYRPPPPSERDTGPIFPSPSIAEPWSRRYRET